MVTLTIEPNGHNQMFCTTQLRGRCSSVMILKINKPINTTNGEQPIYMIQIYCEYTTIHTQSNNSILIRLIFKRDLC